MKTKIKKFGIELEGEYSNELADKMRTKYAWSVKGDGSIHTCDHHQDILHSIEAVSQPIEYSTANVNAIKKLFDFLQVQYNNGDFHFNESCGLHFHFSFTPQRPPELWSEQFAEYFASHIATRFPKAYKLRKENRFCKFELSQKDIASPRFYDRYRFINLRPAFQRHKTLEIRAFPSDEPKLMKRYFLSTLTAIEDFLVKANSGLLDKKYAFKDQTIGTDTINFQEQAKAETITDDDNIVLDVVID